MAVSNYNPLVALDPDLSGPAVYPTPAAAAGGEVEARRVYAAFRRRWRVMLAAFGCVMALGAIYAFFKKPVYEATAMVTVVTAQSASVDSGDLRVLNDLQGLTRTVSAQSHIQLIGRQDVLAAAAGQLPRADVSKGFGDAPIPKWAVRVGLADKDSDVIAITARAYDANIAAAYANAIVDAYVERDQIYSRSATRQGREYVRFELSAVQKQLSDAQNDLASYKRRVNIVSPDSQVTAITNSMVALQNELDNAGVELASAQRHANSLREQLAQEGNEVRETTTVQVNPRYQAAVTALDQLNARRAAMQQEYSPNSKEMRRIDSEIASAERKLEKIAQTIVGQQVRTRNPALNNYSSALAGVASARAKVKALRYVLKARQAKMQKLPAFESELARLTTRVNLLQGIYEDLSQKYYVLLVNENSTLPNARLASAALPPLQPAIPNKPRSLAIFFLLGLLAAVAAAAIAERLDSAIREDNLPALLTGEAPLAVIPHVSSVGSFIESFRTLRNVINSSRSFGTSRSKIMVVTSPNRGEGKRTVAVNLAIAMAWSGKRALLVDCDLREPSLAAGMGVPGDVGLTSLIRGVATADQVIYPTSVENVYCIPTGPAPFHPSQFLNSPGSLDVLREISESFDIVIVNGPPCVGLSDIQVVARASDAVMMVVMMDRTSQDDLKEALANLARVNAPYAGYVLNRVSVEGQTETYYWTKPESSEAEEIEEPALLRALPEQGEDGGEREEGEE